MRALNWCAADFLRARIPPYLEEHGVKGRQHVIQPTQPLAPVATPSLQTAQHPRYPSALPVLGCADKIIIAGFSNDPKFSRSKSPSTPPDPPAALMPLPKKNF